MHLYPVHLALQLTLCVYLCVLRVVVMVVVTVILETSPAYEILLIHCEVDEDVGASLCDPCI